MNAPTERHAISTWSTNNTRSIKPSYDLRGTLRAVVREAEISGINSVRLLPSEARYENARDKVYFVLDTHDLDRDERIVMVMIQLDGIDYDLVPISAVGLVPRDAVDLL